MKKFFILISCLWFLFLSLVSITNAGYTNGYYRNNGTYVEPYQRTERNNTRDDNYSTEGNTNPYTGQKGYNTNSDR